MSRGLEKGGVGRARKEKEGTECGEITNLQSTGGYRKEERKGVVNEGYDI